MIISLIFFIISLSVKWNKQYWTRVLLWPACSLDTILLAFALLHFVLQGQTICNSVFLLTSYFHIPVPYDRKGIFCLVLVLEGIVGIHRTGQLQLLQNQYLGHRLGLLWCWMVFLGNEQKSFCHFWSCTQVLHFRLLWWLWGLLYFFKEILAHSSRYNGHLN